MHYKQIYIKQVTLIKGGRESLKKLGLCSRIPYFQRNMANIISENQSTRKENQIFVSILMTKAKRTIIRNFIPKQKYALQDMMDEAI